MIPGIINYNYDDANRITDAGSTGFVFDNNGNTTRKGSVEYGYDTHNNLISVNGDDYFSYEYDGLGNRRKRIKNGTETRYVLDILGMSRVLMETDAGGNPQNYYVYGLGLISRIDSDNYTRYYHYDYRGSTVAMTDENGSVTHQYVYGPFGEMLMANEEDFNPFRYVGQFGIMYETDDLYFIRVRYYDPHLGRFLGEDPIWGTNLYKYANNNPIIKIDPSGLFFSEIIKGLDPRNAFYLGKAVVRGMVGKIGAWWNGANYTFKMTEKERQAAGKVETGTENIITIDKVAFVVGATIARGKPGFDGSMSILYGLDQVETMSKISKGELSYSEAGVEGVNAALQVLTIGNACDWAKIKFGGEEWVIIAIDTSRQEVVDYAMSEAISE